MRRRTSLAIAGAAAVATGFVVTAVLAFPTGGPGRAIAAPTELPVTLEPFVFNLCLPSTDALGVAADSDTGGGSNSTPGVDYVAFSTRGSGGALTVTVEAPGVWSIEASRRGVTVQDERGAVSAATALVPAPSAITIAQQMYDCLSPYRFVEESTKSASSSTLLQLDRYESTVLWPCLAGQGLNVGDPPTRADFATVFAAQSVDPFRGLNLSRQELPRLIAAAQRCPLRPSYLH